MFIEGFMQHKYRLLSSFIGFSFLSGLSWADSPNNVLSTITLQADQNQENENHLCRK
jgi:iron complex outermembrane receptor protein